jgi:hypothetical protein
VGAEAERQWALAMNPFSGTAFIYAQMLLPQLRHSYDDLRHIVRDAHLLLSHSLVLAAPLVAEVTGIPWVSGVLSPISFNSRVQPPSRRLGRTWHCCPA